MSFIQPLLSSFMPEPREPVAPRVFGDFVDVDNMPRMRLGIVSNSVFSLEQIVTAGEPVPVSMGHNYNSSYPRPMQHVGESVVHAEAVIDKAVPTPDEVNKKYESILAGVGGEEADQRAWAEYLSQAASEFANSGEVTSAHITEVTNRN
jgi:hypothetical protein